jgi:hypothetical protein
MGGGQNKKRQRESALFRPIDSARRSHNARTLREMARGSGESG